MNETAKKVIYILIGITILFSIGFYFMKKETKSYSPEDTVNFQQNGLQLEVFYNRPYKKGREIFGGLVPYNTVWRTGANEATTFTTNQDILIDGSLLKAGKYTLWTIPMQDSWKVIFNSKMYNWGIDMQGNASRDPEYDVLTLQLPTNQLYNVVEQFSIYFEPSNDMVLMFLAWDKTAVMFPIKQI